MIQQNDGIMHLRETTDTFAVNANDKISTKEKGKMLRRSRQWRHGSEAEPKAAGVEGQPAGSRELTNSAP